MQKWTEIALFADLTLQKKPGPAAAAPGFFFVIPVSRRL
jgi:hypothetical protein